MRKQEFLPQCSTRLPPFYPSTNQLVNDLISENSSKLVEQNAYTDSPFDSEVGAGSQLVNRLNEAGLPTLPVDSRSKTKFPLLSPSSAFDPFSSSNHQTFRGNGHNDKLYSLFADPVKGPSISLLMNQLSKTFNGQLPGALSFSDSDSVKSGSNASCLVENHIYEEILYECLEKQGQLTPEDKHSLGMVLGQTANRMAAVGLHPNNTPPEHSSLDFLQGTQI